MTPEQRQAADELRRLMGEAAARSSRWLSAEFTTAARNHLPVILGALEEVNARADALAARVAELEEGLRSTLKEGEIARAAERERR